MNTPANTRPDRIVVVDDDARIRDLLRRYLTQEGFEVLLAEDAKALNRILTRETIDLIVLDLMLPGEDGLSICRRLRAANDVTASSASKSAPTTTCPSRSTRANCWPACTRCCAAARRWKPPARRRRNRRPWPSARSSSTSRCAA
jgi:CheY-like chemotaxis protein